MAAKLLFIHGTGVRDVSGTVAQLRERAPQILGVLPERIVALEWGKAVGPHDLDIRPSLPPDYATKGTGPDEATNAEETAALWAVLLADPVAELRLLAGGPQMPTGGGLVVGADPADVKFRNAVSGAAVDSALLTRAGFTDADFTAARDQIVSDPLLTTAAARRADPADPELVLATSHEIVARLIAARWASAEPPLAAYDPQVRDNLVEAIGLAISPATKGWAGDLVKKALSPVATKVAVARRADVMGPLGDFLRDVAFYIQHGQQVRDWLATEIGKHTDGDPLIVIAHSLGGIVCVDLLADPAYGQGLNKLPVTLLVTVGSQSPFVYLLDSMALLSPNEQSANHVNKPFVPWLNIYNRDDLLSFCAEAIWPNGRIWDESIAPGIPFPMSHSAYWAQDHTYELIKARLA